MRRRVAASHETSRQGAPVGQANIPRRRSAANGRIQTTRRIVSSLCVCVGLTALFQCVVSFECQPRPSVSWTVSCRSRRPFSIRHSSSSTRLLAEPSTTTTSSSSTSPSSSPKNPVTRQIGKWEDLHGNFLLRPPVDDGPPRALIHFLGGALVGAGPHISYRYMLERLAAEGYLVVATPYNLSFDHLSSCDSVIERFERIAGYLARTYGALPVVGVGHSNGALLQLLITSLFPDTPRAANALLSFNNKPVTEAVPFFEEIVSPFFTYVAALDDESRASGSDIISVGLKLAVASTSGELPSDDLLTHASHLVVPPGIQELINRDEQKEIVVPNALREAYSTLMAAPASVMASTGLTPVMIETLEALQQIPMLIDEVAGGVRDFTPSPLEVQAAARRAYRARRTLLIKYTEDPLDESEELEELLEAAGQVVRMRRPMINFDVQCRNLPGGHAAPLLAPPLELATRAETILGAEAAKESLRYTEADQTVQELVRWLEESNL